MQILHVYKDYFPLVGGIENHVKMLAEAQAARGHDVSVLVTSRDKRSHVERINGVRVIYAARLATISSAPVSLAFLGLLARERPDIVHLQFPYPWGELANYFVGHGRKTVLTYQSDIVRQKYLRVLYAPMMQRVLERVDAIIATSPNYIATSPVLSRWKRKCVVVPLGIDPAPFLPAPLSRASPALHERPTRREEPIASPSFKGAPLPSPVSKGEPLPPPTSKGEPLPSSPSKGGDRGGLVLFVGHLRYYKGLKYLLQALRELSSTRLVVVGTGEMRGELENLAQELGVGPQVNFVGEVTNADLPSFYQACDVFVLPSSERSEAFGLVQLEAMAAGKPVVSCDIGTGVTWVNQNEVTGLVVPPRDPLALANAIKRLLSNNDLAAKMGAAGRSRVLAEFTIEKMVERVMSVYKGFRQASSRSGV